MTLEERILDKLEKIEERIGEQNVTLAVNTQQLTEHIRRTSLLEESVDKLRNEAKPVQAHVANMQLAGRTAAFAAKVLAGVLAAAAAIAKIIGS